MVFSLDSVWVSKMSYWIDTHCHMTEDIYRQNFAQYMTNAKENNVLVSNLICLNKNDLQRALEIQKEYPSCDVSFGYFPEDANHITDDDLSFLEEVIKEGKIKGVGEIGLDYHYGKEFVNEQKALLIKQIELANKYGLPIMIHSRDASQDTFDILKKYAKTKVLMHCYSDSLEMMREYLKLGFYISFSGVVTFKNAKSPKENALNCPLDRMMIETDCPYLTPAPFRGQTNETAYVRYTGEYIAQLRELSIGQLQVQLMKNYESFWSK